MRPVSAASVSRKFPCHEMMIARRACTPAGIAVCVGAQAAKAAAATDTGPTGTARSAARGYHPAAVLGPISR